MTLKLVRPDDRAVRQGGERFGEPGRRVIAHREGGQFGGTRRVDGTGQGIVEIGRRRVCRAVRCEVGDRVDRERVGRRHHGFLSGASWGRS
ncbi:hypothetical protein ACU686_24510 [Yinghuangia aomiensis]